MNETIGFKTNCFASKLGAIQFIKKLSPVVGVTALLILNAVCGELPNTAKNAKNLLRIRRNYWETTGIIHRFKYLPKTSGDISDFNFMTEYCSVI